ncbi:MAG: hypothetical protein AAB646_00570, partial [Patescibacteria group bacterium]
MPFQDWPDGQVVVVDVDEVVASFTHDDPSKCCPDGQVVGVVVVVVASFTHDDPSKCWPDGQVVVVVVVVVTHADPFQYCPDG